MLIRPAANADANAIWTIMEPIIRAGETYTLPRDMDKEPALAYWLAAEHEVFVAEEGAKLLAPIFCRRISRVAEDTLQTVDT